MRRKGDVKLEKAFEYGIVIVIISAFTVFLISNILQIKVTLNQGTEQRQAVLFAEDLLASDQFIITDNLPKKGLFDASKLNVLENKCQDLKVKYTDVGNLYGVKIENTDGSRTWIICPSDGDRRIAYPVTVYSATTGAKTARLVITYA